MLLAVDIIKSGGSMICSSENESSSDMQIDLAASIRNCYIPLRKTICFNNDFTYYEVAGYFQAKT